MKTGQTIHFIGIGGIGMSGLAKIFLSQGRKVQGTDVKSSEMTALLEQMALRSTLAMTHCISRARTS